MLLLGDRAANGLFFGWIAPPSPYKAGYSGIHSILYGMCYSYEKMSDLFINVFQNVKRFEKIKEWTERLKSQSDMCMFFFLSHQESFCGIFVLLSDRDLLIAAFYGRMKALPILYLLSQCFPEIGWWKHFVSVKKKT